jgi:hypothetical protein
MKFTRENVKATKRKVSAKPPLHLIFKIPVSDKLFYGKNSYRIKSYYMITNFNQFPNSKTQKR